MGSGEAARLGGNEMSLDKETNQGKALQTEKKAIPTFIVSVPRRYVPFGHGGKKSG